MFFVYSILLSIGFLLLSPMFLLRREKYASGFGQRLGDYPEFENGRSVIWLHCVSVGETNAAQPLVEKLRTELPDHRLVISTTTRTGQEIARKLFSNHADAIIYFPFDWKFSVRRALDRYRPSLVLLMETEIWPRFIHEAKLSGAKIAIVNGRLSQRSFDRYSKIRSFLTRVLADVDLALMQTAADADRITRLGIDPRKVAVTGNLKFEQTTRGSDAELTDYFRTRFGISTDKPLIIAASTHEPEEQMVIDALESKLGPSCRLMLVPRHPERFDTVGRLLVESSYTFVRRSTDPSEIDKTADVILLDTIGELRAAYPLAEMVFVGGSLVPHGGQSILEPAAAGKAIVTGPYTHNFDAVVKTFLDNEAVRQTTLDGEREQLRRAFTELLADGEARARLASNAARVVASSSQDASVVTIDLLKTLKSFDTLREKLKTDR